MKNESGQGGGGGGQPCMPTVWPPTPNICIAIRNEYCCLIRVYQGYSFPAPVADDVYEARGLEATGCRLRSCGGGEHRSGVIGVSPRGKGKRSSISPLWQSHAHSRQRGDLAHAGEKIPVRRPHRRFRGRDDCSAG